MTAVRLMTRFEGLVRAHGTYEIKESRGDGKRIGKATTKHEPVTEALWNDHVGGKRTIGIIPINDDSECKFGAIDIDVYSNFDYMAAINEVHAKNFPLIPCRSKSGGLHLYLFTSEFVPAAVMQSRLREMASALGFGTSEIFPKQTQILAERGDIGQWINMPYFNGDSTDRYAYSRDGEQLTMDQFIQLADDTQISAYELENATIKLDSSDYFADGPPCLKYLATYGFPQGTRNNSLFNVGVYLRLRFPDDWAQKLEEYNFQLMKPPLSADEVLNVAKSLRKKNYGFTCNKTPISPHCHMADCRMQKFGVGQQAGNMPVVHSLTKFDTDPPIWFLDVEGGGRLECVTDDLQNQRRFQKLCMERLNLMPPPIGQQAWSQMINSLMDNLTVIEAPRDASETGQLWIHVEDFCTGRQAGREREDLLLGRPWYDEEVDVYYFRMTDLMSYLDRHHFRAFKVHEITSKLREAGAFHKFFNLKGKGTNVWATRHFNPQNKPLDLPKELQDGDEMPF